MQRAEILDTAKRAVADRGLNYGQPEDNFQRIANRWNTHLENLGMDADLTAESVAIMLADVKIARLENDPTHADSWIDMAGYAACGGEIATSRTFGDLDAGVPTDAPESKFGFTVGETVNNIRSAYGSKPGKVMGFDSDNRVRVLWNHWKTTDPTAAFLPHELRHGP